MKSIFCLFLLIISISNIKAQKTDKTIPNYRLLTQDSVYITQANLKKDKPVMIIYFSPDCTHCQHLTYELKDEFDKEAKNHTKELKHVQIVMATWTELRAIQIFYKEYGLNKYPNITVGTEGTTMTLQRYYQVRTTPYIAIYAKGGQLVKAFDTIPKLSEIIATLKKV